MSIARRPTADEGDQNITATLRLFSSDTDPSVINDEAQAEAAALASQDFTITLVAAEREYFLTLKIQDPDQKEITEAAVTLEDKDSFNTVSPKSDGTYKVTEGKQYKLTVTKDGYNDYTENLTFSGRTEKLV